MTTIQPEEIRIGNWVLDKTGFDQPYKKVIGIQKSAGWTGGHAIEFRGGWVGISELTGIELTEDILLKCGFEKRLHEQFGETGWFGIAYSTSIEGMEIVIHKESFRCAINHLPNMARGCYSAYAKNEIRYLHQLQNIYHALTFEELEINL